MHDTVWFEIQGLPSVSIASSEFAEGAEAQRKALRMDDARYVLVDPRSRHDGRGNAGQGAKRPGRGYRRADDLSFWWRSADQAVLVPARAAQLVR